jgi:hypothetical protein
MKTVARLMWIYLTPTPLLAAASSIGVVLVLASTIILVNPSLKEAVGDVALWLPMVGIGGLYVGSALMPLVFGRLARGHAIHTLPFSRIRLLSSFFAVMLLISSLAPLFWLLGNWELARPAFQTRDPVLLAQYWGFLFPVLITIYSSACLLSGWLYLTLWLATSQRNAAGLAKGFIVLLFALYAPIRAMQTLQSSVALNLALVALAWGTFAVSFLWWPRVRVLAGRMSGWLTLRTPELPVGRRAGAGRDVDLYLGTSRPWVLAGALALPMIVAALIGHYSAAFLFFYANIFSAVSGAIAGQAAERSRSLWLRTRWSRIELFGQVERSFWRHNVFVLAMVTALILFVGMQLKLSPMLLAVGIVLVVLGTTLSTYLGLMLTSGIHWIEATLGVAVMLALMAMAVIVAAGPDSYSNLVASELLLAVVAVVLRFVARSRWAHIDWTQCRPLRAGIGRQA